MRERGAMEVERERLLLRDLVRTRIAAALLGDHLQVQRWGKEALASVSGRGVVFALGSRIEYWIHMYICE